MVRSRVEYTPAIPVTLGAGSDAVSGDAQKAQLLRFL